MADDRHRDLPSSDASLDACILLQLMLFILAGMHACLQINRPPPPISFLHGTATTLFALLSALAGFGFTQSSDSSSAATSLNQLPFPPLPPPPVNWLPGLFLSGLMEACCTGFDRKHRLRSGYLKMRQAKEHPEVISQMLLGPFG